MTAKQKPKSQWGGTRKNAGAPGKPRPTRKPPEERFDRHYGVKVDDSLEGWLEEQRRADENDGDLLRRLLNQVREKTS